MVKLNKYTHSVEKKSTKLMQNFHRGIGMEFQNKFNISDPMTYTIGIIISVTSRNNNVILV